MKINYQQKVDQAKLGVVKNIVQNIQQKLGAHLNEIHITFVTNFPELKISANLQKLFPNEMTIVLKNNYESISIENNIITFTHTFLSGKETIHIPLGAITLFADHANEYAMKFKPEIFNKNNQINDTKIVSIDFSTS